MSLQITLSLSKSSRLFEIRPGTRFKIVMEKIGQKWKMGDPSKTYKKVRNDGLCLCETTGADAVILNSAIINTL